MEECWRVFRMSVARNEIQREGEIEGFKARFQNL